MSTEPFSIRQAQQDVDTWIQSVGGYFSELTNMAQLTEEVGEVARVISRTYGEQSFKATDRDASLAGELSDVLLVLFCLANQTGIDLEAAFRENLAAKTARDSDRHRENPKLSGGDSR